jgi:hypothetical protein
MVMVCDSTLWPEQTYMCMGVIPLFQPPLLSGTLRTTQYPLSPRKLAKLV